MRTGYCMHCGEVCSDDSMHACFVPTPAEPDEIESALLATEGWAVEHFVGDSPMMTRRNDAWAVCQELRRLRALAPRPATGDGEWEKAAKGG